MVRRRRTRGSSGRHGRVGQNELVAYANACSNDATAAGVLGFAEVRFFLYTAEHRDLFLPCRDTAGRRGPLHLGW